VSDTRLGVLGDTGTYIVAVAKPRAEHSRRQLISLGLASQTSPHTRGIRSEGKSSARHARQNSGDINANGDTCDVSHHGSGDGSEAKVDEEQHTPTLQTPSSAVYAALPVLRIGKTRCSKLECTHSCTHTLWFRVHPAW
jgi:hypothetical protein